MAITIQTPTYIAGYGVQSAVQTIINALAVRDTANHDPLADPTNVSAADMRYLPAGHAIYVNNGCNQTVTISLMPSPDGTGAALAGSSTTVAANTQAWIDPITISQVNNPYPYISVRASYGSGPASGTLTVSVSGSSTSALIPPATVTNTAGNYRIQDGVGAALASVSTFHNSDNQSLAGIANVVGTAGIALVLNPLGNGDRDRATGFDGAPSQGINANAANFLQQVLTTIPTVGTIASGAATATVTPGSMGSLAANNLISKGTTAVIDSGAGAEQVFVTATTGSTATIVPLNGAPGAPSFLFNHTPAYNFLYDVYNRERDALGEASGATGVGTAVAAEYEETSGGPPLANGTPSLLRFDREVALLGKAASNAGAGFAITSTTAGDTLITPTTPGNFKTLTPGQWIQLTGSGTTEYVRVATGYTIAASPATVALTSPVVNTGQTTATWDAFSALGPGTNPVLLTGEGMEGVLLNDATKPGLGRMWQGDPLGNGKVVSVNGTRATYTYAISATAPYATATDWIVIRGSASKTVKIQRIELSGAATAATEILFLLNKHTVANTAGTSTTPTPMQHDSADAAATAVALLYSVAPTITGSFTIWKTARLTLALAPAATTVAPDRYVFDASALVEPLVLRGVAQEFALNFNGATVPTGGVLDVAITFTEE